MYYPRNSPARISDDIVAGITLAKVARDFPDGGIAGVIVEEELSKPAI